VQQQKQQSQQQTQQSQAVDQKIDGIKDLLQQAVAKDKRKEALPKLYLELHQADHAASAAVLSQLGATAEQLPPGERKQLRFFIAEATGTPAVSLLAAWFVLMRAARSTFPSKMHHAWSPRCTSLQPVWHCITHLQLTCMPA
jgi:hypothetical protein